MKTKTKPATKEKIATATSPIEAELLKVTGEKKQREGEKRGDYIARVVNSANDLKEAVFEKLTETAQNWVGDNVELHNDGKKVKDFPSAKAAEEDSEDEEEDSDDEESDDETEDDDSEEEEDDEESSDDDEEDDDAAEEDEDSDSDDEEEAEDGEEEDEEGDDEDEDSEDDAEEDDAEDEDSESDDDEDGEENEDDADEEAEPVAAKKKSKDKKSAPKEAVKPDPNAGTKVLRRMICSHLEWDRDKLTLRMKKAGHEVSKSTLTVTYYDTHATVKVLKELGWRAPKVAAE